MSNSSASKPFLQLDRLKTLMDVIYGLVIVQLFLNIPKPVDDDWQWNTFSGYMAENGLIILYSIIGLLIVIIYWSQNNVLLGRLDHTDQKHTFMIILQVVCLFGFLYATQLGLAFGGSPAGRAFEGGIVALMGFAGLASWNYARKNRRLISDSVSDDEAKELSVRYRVEPFTALFTLLFVFTPILWEVSWFAYPIFVGISKWRERRKEKKS